MNAASIDSTMNGSVTGLTIAGYPLACRRRHVAVERTSVSLVLGGGKTFVH